MIKHDAVIIIEGKDLLDVARQIETFLHTNPYNIKEVQYSSSGCLFWKHFSCLIIYGP